MFDPNLVWAFWIFFFALFEGAALVNRKDGDTFSERTRDWFKVNTKRGRIAFGVTWVGFAGWYLWHILWQ